MIDLGVNMYIDKHSIPPWLRNVYPFKSWLHNSEEPVITPYGTFHLKRGEYRILPNGIVIGRCRICGKPVISNIKRPRKEWVLCEVHRRLILR